MTDRRRTLAVLVGATGAAQASVLLASPVLTRLFTPADFGAYAGALAIVAVVTVVACLRYEQAIPLPDDPTTLAALVVLCLGLGLITTAATGAVLIVGGGTVATALGLPPIQALIAPILLAVLGGAGYQVLSMYAVGAGEYGPIARTRVTQAVGMAGLQVGLGVLGAGAPGLLAGDAMGRGGGTLRLAQLAWERSGGAIRRLRRSDVRRVANRYRRFALLSSPSALLDVVGIQAPTLIVITLFGPVVAGWYLLAARVATIPNALSAASVGLVFLGDASGLARSDPARLLSTFDSAVRRLFLWGVVPALLLAIAAPLLFPIVFGADWAESGIYAALLAPVALAQLVSSPVSSILVVLERQDLHLAREITAIGVLVVAFGIAVLGKLEATWAIALLSAAGTLNAVIYLVIMRQAILWARERARSDPASGEESP